MPVSIILDYDFNACVLDATIWDSDNRGKDGIVRIQISGESPNDARNFTNLTDTKQTLQFDVTRDGMVRKFDGTVDIGVDFGHTLIFTATCNPADAEPAVVAEDP